MAPASGSSSRRSSSRTQRRRINLFDNDYTDDIDAALDYDLPAGKRTKLYDPPKENSPFAVVIYRTPTSSQEPQSQTRVSEPPPGLKEEPDDLLSPTFPSGSQDDADMNCSQEQLALMGLDEKPNITDTQESGEIRESQQFSTQESGEIRESPRPRGRPRKKPVASDVSASKEVEKVREGTSKTAKTAKAAATAKTSTTAKASTAAKTPTTAKLSTIAKPSTTAKAGTKHSATPPPSVIAEKRVRFDPQITKDDASSTTKQSSGESAPVTQPQQRWRAVRVPSGSAATTPAASGPSTTAPKPAEKTPDATNATKKTPPVPVPTDEDVDMMDIDAAGPSSATTPQVIAPAFRPPAQHHQHAPIQEEQRDNPTDTMRPLNAVKLKKSKTPALQSATPAEFINAEVPNYKKCKFCESIVIHMNNIKGMELHLKTPAHKSKEQTATSEGFVGSVLSPSLSREHSHSSQSHSPVPREDTDMTSAPPLASNNLQTQPTRPSPLTDPKYNNIFVQSVSPGFLKCKFCNTQLFQADSIDALESHLWSTFHQKRVAAAGYRVAHDGSLQFVGSGAHPAGPSHAGEPGQYHHNPAQQRPSSPPKGPVNIPFGFVDTDNPNDKTCGICRDGLRIPVSNVSIMQMHVNSNSHKEKLARLTASVAAVTNQNAPTPPESTPVNPPKIPEGFVDTDNPNEKTCGVCRDSLRIPLENIQMMEMHVKSRQHQQKLSALEPVSVPEEPVAEKPSAFSSRMAEPNPATETDIAPPPTGRMFATTIIDEDGATRQTRPILTPKGKGNAASASTTAAPPKPSVPVSKPAEVKKKVVPSRPLSKPKSKTAQAQAEGSKRRLSSSNADPMLTTRKPSMSETHRPSTSTSDARPASSTSLGKQAINPLTGKLELVKPTSNRNKNERLLSPSRQPKKESISPEPPKQDSATLQAERLKIAKDRLLGLKNFWKLIRMKFKEENNFLQWYTTGKVDENINKRAKDISYTNYTECKHLVEETNFKELLEKMLGTKRVITDMARDDIRALHRKFFENKNFASANLPYDDLAGDDDLSDSEDDEPSLASTSTAATGPLLPPSDSDRITTGPFRDIVIGVNKRGGRKYELHKNAEKRPADVYGHNGITVGAWWPLQKCALRDGAHGSNMGGIYGRTSDGKGAFSVVASGGYNENNIDSGNIIWYSGSGGMTTKSGKASAKQVDNQGETLGNKSLLRSIESGKPVRVIRSSKLQSAYAPSSGFRYDGLYKVTYYKKVMNKGFFHYSFKLVREEGQLPINQDRPTSAEVKEVQRYVPSFS